MLHNFLQIFWAGIQNFDTLIIAQFFAVVKGMIEGEGWMGDGRFCDSSDLRLRVTLWWMRVAGGVAFTEEV